MDLALNLGMTVSALEREMTTAEFDLWIRYASKRVLPWRRMELYLAQIALKVVQVMGGNIDAVLSDYIFDLSSEVDESNSAEEFFAFAPRKVKESEDGK